MKKILAISLIGLSACGHALATPVALNAADFAAALAPLTKVVETFEGFKTGPYPAPLELANSTFTSNFPFVISGYRWFPTKFLINQNLDGALGRVFSGFAAGTRLFGLDISSFGALELMEVTVTGASGTLTFQQTMASFGGFFGVEDDLGLSSVSFRNLGYQSGWSNFAFDNVTTGSSTVPEPGSLALALLAMAGLLTMGSRAKYLRS